MTSSPLKVLLLGVHMAPGEPFTEEDLIKMIEGDLAKGPSNGLDCQYFLTHTAQPDYAGVITKLKSDKWDIVAVGAGVRFPRERAALFEWMVNAAIRTVKPLPTMVFNTTPHGVTEACLRVKPEMERLRELNVDV